MNGQRITDFIERCSRSAYAEPASDLHTEISKDIWRRCKDLFVLPPNSLVLDLGCGSGHAMKMFEDDGYFVHGVTCVSEEAKLYRGSSDIFCLDMHDIGTFTEKYDLVWARHILEHSPIPAFVLQEIYYLVKVGGYLYVEVPGSTEEGSTSGHDRDNANHWSVLGKTMWSTIINRSGFTILKSSEVTFRTQLGSEVYHGFVAQKIAQTAR